MFPSTVPDALTRDLAAEAPLFPTLVTGRTLPLRADFADAGLDLAADPDDAFASGFAADLTLALLDAAEVDDDSGFDLTLRGDFALAATPFASVGDRFPDPDAFAARAGGCRGTVFLETAALDAVQSTAISAVVDFVLLLALRSLWDDM